MNATVLYRIGNYFFRRRIPGVPMIFKILIRIVFNCAIDPATKIGKGSYFAYGGIAVVIHKRAIIGENVVISQGVTIGGRSGKKNVPIIGNGVYVGANAVVLGDVTVGDNVTIGAGAVVLNDVPSNETWAGVPAKKIK